MNKIKRKTILEILKSDLSFNIKINFISNCLNQPKEDIERLIINSGFNNKRILSIFEYFSESKNNLYYSSGGVSELTFIKKGVE